MSLRDRLLEFPWGARELRLARQRRRWEIIRHRWPTGTRVKTQYHRRRRTR